MRRNITTILFIMISLAVLAATPVAALLDSLITKGNRAYELSQPSKIKNYADSISLILKLSGLDGDALPDYSVSMLKLYGNYHYEKDKLDSAEYYYNEAKKIIDGNPSTDFHGNVLLLPREFAQLYYRRGQYAEAEAVMRPVYDDIVYNNRYDAEVNSDEYVKFMMSYAMCLARLKRFDEAMEIAEDAMNNAVDKNSQEYAKGQRMYAKIMLLANAGIQGALKAYKSYFQTQKRYAFENFSQLTAKERVEYWHTLRPFIADCYLLEEADAGFLYDVTLFSKGLLLHLTRLAGKGKADVSALQTLDYKWQDIQKRLGRGEAAIEFVQYGEGERQKMGALLVRQAALPQFIPLTSPDEVIASVGESLNSTSRSDKDRLYGDSRLHEMIWTPTLLEALQGVKRLYFAPDGYLHRLAIEYMPPVENLDVCRLTSTRRLMDGKAALAPDSPILAFGSINYDFEKSHGEEVSNDSVAYSYYIGKYFSELPTSTDETRDILQLRQNEKDSIMTGMDATEFAFRHMAEKYPSVILSTHGYFQAKTPVSTDLKPVAEDETMSRSILAFAGVNSNIKDSAFESSSHCDGILSARELAEMDLSGCKLFTASACQSALGELSADGVFGLQRGLKNAGVDSMLLSLWDVNSVATSILMKEFYQSLSRGEPLRKAFMLARRKLLSDTQLEIEEYVFDPATLTFITEKKISSNPFKSPQFANAFILIDAID